MNFCHDEDEAQDILSKLEGLDEIYEYDSELSKFKEKKLKVIDDLRNKLSDSKFDFCVDRKVKLLNALKLLETELEKNIISKEGKKKVKEKIENVCGKPANIAYFQSIGDFNHIGGKLQIPTVLFGADGENFHSSDERVSLTSAVEVADCICEFVSDVLSD